MSSADKITKFHQYHRGAGNSRRGVIAAEYNHTTRSFKIAHSLCSLTDNLDPQVGVMIAKGRLHDMEWTPINQLDNSFVVAKIPWSMEDTLDAVRNRLIGIHYKSEETNSSSGDLRIREEDGPTEAQIDRIISQGVQDAREAIQAGVCGGQCGCCG